MAKIYRVYRKITLRKCPYDHWLTNKACLSAVTVTNISQSFSYKMAAKVDWNRHGTKLRHCHPMCSRFRCATWRKINSSNNDNNSLFSGWLNCVDTHDDAVGHGLRRAPVEHAGRVELARVRRLRVAARVRLRRTRDDDILAAQRRRKTRRMRRRSAVSAPYEHTTTTTSV